MQKLVDETKKAETEVSELRRQKEFISRQIEEAKMQGTLELGDIDRDRDGLSTIRRRRQVIVLQQRRGSSLCETLKNSEVLKKLGMSF